MTLLLRFNFLSSSSTAFSSFLLDTGLERRFYCTYTTLVRWVCEGFVSDMENIRHKPFANRFTRNIQTKFNLKKYVKMFNYDCIFWRTLLILTFVHMFSWIFENKAQNVILNDHAILGIICPTKHLFIKKAIR